MESNGEGKIVILLEQIIKLLQDNDEEQWANHMKRMMDNYIHLTHSKTKKEAAILIKKTMLGGMGSLSDLALYGNGKPLIEENRKLRMLLSELFKECELIQYERLSTRLADTFVNSQYNTHEMDEDYTVYRNFSDNEISGKFFWGPRLKPSKDETTADPIEEDYAITLPVGALLRVGKVAVQDGIISKGRTQGYVEKPWRIAGLKIVKNKT